MDSSMIKELWSNKDLTREDIYDYFVSQYNVRYYFDFFKLNENDLMHVAECCYAIFKYDKMDIPPGDFIKAVLRDNLREAAARADRVNKKSLWLYTMFLDNCVSISKVKDFKQSFSRE